MKILLVTATAIVVIAATGAHKQPVPIANQDPQASHEKVSCHSVDGLPDPSCTPGAVRLGADTVDAICNSGSTRQWRPNTSVTNALKKQGIIDYGEPHTGKYNSFVKDKVENWLHKQVCSGAMTPKDAQQGIATDWRQYIPNVVQTSTKEVE